MLVFYKVITMLSAPLLALLLKRRVLRGKEDPTRLNERRGIASRPSPKGSLIWIHAASVGEAQSALILIDKISKIKPDTHFLVTSGTLTSASLMAKRLPAKAIHQFYPLDHPLWIGRFLDYWQPDIALWMESELWPNMLLAIKNRNIPAVLINARLSENSFKRWKYLAGTANKILQTFALIMTQTNLDAVRYETLGAKNVITTDNLKYSAAPLPHDSDDLETLQTAIKNRPVWLYASTHDGEETLACDIHLALKKQHKDLLTIIVPRHPERREEILQGCKNAELNIVLRGNNKNLPTQGTDIYIADTLGELGLFYRLCSISMIGRSFSNDGGGGHNPIEAAQLDCAVLTGANVQYQTQLFNEMLSANAVWQAQTKEELQTALATLLSSPEEQGKLKLAAKKYANEKEHIIDTVMENLTPLLGTKKQEAN